MEAPITEEELVQALRNYRQKFENAEWLFKFLADIGERMGGLPNTLSLPLLAKEQQQTLYEVKRFYVYLDHLGVGRFARREQRFYFHLCPMDIGYLGMTKEEQEEFDEYFHG